MPLDTDEADLVISLPRNVIGRSDVDIPAVERMIKLRLNGLRLRDLFRRDPSALQHIEEVGVAAGVELISPIDADAPVGKQPSQCPMYDRRTELAFDVITNDGDPGLPKLLCPIRVRGEEDGNAIDHGHAGIQARLSIMFDRLLRPNRQIAQQNL